LSVEDQRKFFPGRDEGFDADVVYNFVHKHEFDLGYGEFNDWREQLARIELGASSAFQEIIEFPDNEGVIGPAVAKKLAVDFQKFEPQAKLEGDVFYTIYSKWKKAFETTSDNGAVQSQ
jgi:hypothetical protein